MNGTRLALKDNKIRGAATENIVVPRRMIGSSLFWCGGLYVQAKEVLAASASLLYCKGDIGFVFRRPSMWLRLLLFWLHCRRC